MSTRSTQPAGEARTTARRSRDPLAGESAGWLAFAGVMLAMAGIMNFIYGIAAVSSSHVFARDANYVFSDLKTYGWIVMIIGAVQFAAAFSIFTGTSWGRFVGIVTAGLNGIAQLLYISSYPLLSLSLFALDLLVLYALIVHGGRSAERMA
jgi:hypothetical protein